MKRSPIKRRTPLKRTRINYQSAKRASNRIWYKTVREAAFIRANGQCEVCHNEHLDFRGLAPHHKIHRSQLGGDSLENIIICCGFCHDAFHRIKDVGV